MKSNKISKLVIKKSIEKQGGGLLKSKEPQGLLEEMIDKHDALVDSVKWLNVKFWAFLALFVFHLVLMFLAK